MGFNSLVCFTLSEDLCRLWCVGFDELRHFQPELMFCAGGAEFQGVVVDSETIMQFSPEAIIGGLNEE